MPVKSVEAQCPPVRVVVRRAGDRSGKSRGKNVSRKFLIETKCRVLLEDFVWVGQRLTVKSGGDGALLLWRRLDGLHRVNDESLGP
ncbi:hypothetical protein TNCV_897271 [Trichonephila clavipes]|nr:hypothetical protein TNCV_897271 [Trichonephila clavipes]